MRYRVNNYGLSVNNVNHRLMIYFDAPEGYIDEDSGKTLAEQMKEAVRLVVDETAKIVFTSSMQKDKILTIDTTTGQTGFGYRMIFDIPTGKTVTVNDLFTLEFDFGDAPGASPSADAVAAFFNLPQSLPDYHAMTEAEVLEIADEEWQAMYGYVAVPNTVHTVDGGGSERVFTTYMNPNKTYADYGWPALWDAQGETIALTDHPTAGRVIYTFNPIND